MVKPSLAGMSRRSFLTLSATAVGGAAAAGYLIERAFSADPAGSGSLNDIEHIVLLMQENRSFDHYFGTLSGVRGFEDRSGPFRQAGYPPNPHSQLGPFRLGGNAQPEVSMLLPADPGHSWHTQHWAWNHGAMDEWLPAHVESDGVTYAPLVMGYYTRADIPVHYQLADAFTVCDNYFCSVMGPTAPNRMFWMGGTVDPDGAAGGPVIGGSSQITPGSLSWQTFPEVLSRAGVSWKVYNHLAPGQRSQISGMLDLFRNYQDPRSELYQRGRAPRWPRDFHRDVQNGKLPAVSWVIPATADSEHPAATPAVGAETILSVLDVLTAHPAVWEKTALIVSYDENGGFFDHVAPPVPAPGTPGEFVRAGAFAGPLPIGLGFRVPCLVLSPYTRGGVIASQTFDHTSQLALVGARFGVPVPHVSPWRRNTVADMTELFEQSPATHSTARPTTIDFAAAEKRARDSLVELARVKERPAAPLVIRDDTVPQQERVPVRRHVPVALG